MWKARLAYDGTRYFGWQKTKMGPSIQEEMEKAILQLSGEVVVPEAASRTDRGVHAEGQVIQFALKKSIPPQRLLRGLNALLPADIRVLEITPQQFHPTLDALGKEYHYWICLGPVQDPIYRLYSWHFRYPLNIANIEIAAQAFMGTHDFTAFANGEEKNPICTLQSIQFQQSRFQIRGNRFLYRMVRKLVGTLVYIGCGKLPPDSIPEMLASRDRKKRASPPLRTASIYTKSSTQYNREMITRNDPCWCGSGQKWKKCHYPQLPSSSLASQYLLKYGIILKTPEQISKIKAACQITAQILDKLCKHAKAGVTTLELDEFSRKLHQEAGVTSASLGYGSPPFPKTICTSLNEVICHGIPDQRPLQEGDIVNIDVSCILDGFFGDCSRMVAIGKISEEKKRVMDVSLHCLNLSMNVCKPGNEVWHIGKVIEDYARAHGCSVVNQFVGHGVGIAFHEPPEIPHHYNDLHIPFAPGMTFTIEPMINAGVREGVVDPADGWTVRTKDGKPSAQWEHTLLITETGHEILTLI